jgi:hypothetical protein
VDRPFAACIDLLDGQRASLLGRLLEWRARDDGPPTPRFIWNCDKKRGIACRGRLGGLTLGGPFRKTRPTSACDAAEFLEIAEDILDQMTPSIHREIAMDVSRPVGFGRDDGGGATFVHLGAQPVIVEGLVADQRGKIDDGDQRCNADAIMALAGQQDEADQIAECIDQRHDLDRQAAARAAKGLIASPSFAPVPC